jgi:uncharacterized Fe-S cluster-containing radical SAM superfamily protein
MIGCNLSCVYCWVPDCRRVESKECQVEKFGYQPPEDTYTLLKTMAQKNDLHTVRVSGCEPLLNKKHILRVVQLAVGDGYRYVLDTNGLLLDAQFLDELEPYKTNVHFYIGLKGANPEHFHLLTLQDKNLFFKQIEALKMITARKYTLGVNLMANLTPPSMLRNLFLRLYDVSPTLPLSLDMKYITFFAHVSRRMRHYNVQRYSGIQTKKAWQQILEEQYAPDELSNIIYDNGLKFVSNYIRAT